MNTWYTDTLPEIGDMGQFMEWDAEVVTVHADDERVTVEIFDDEQGNRFVEMPYLVV